MDALKNFQPIQPYLIRGERVLWTGQPKQGLALRAMDALLIPASLIWGGFIIIWNAMVWRAPTDWFFKLWGLPFLIIAIYFFVGRFFHDAHIRKNLSYAVTDQRILVLHRSKMTSLDIHRLPRIELHEHSDGTGTLTFDANTLSWLGMNGINWWLPVLSGATQFFRIEGPRKVYELIRDQVNS